MFVHVCAWREGSCISESVSAHVGLCDLVLVVPVCGHVCVCVFLGVSECVMCVCVEREREVTFFENSKKPLPLEAVCFSRDHLEQLCQARQHRYFLYPYNLLLGPVHPVFT